MFVHLLHISQPLVLALGVVRTNRTPRKTVGLEVLV